MALKLRENLLRLMKEKGLTQTELSKLSGIPKTTLSNYINSSQKNQSKYDIAQIKKLSDVLKTDFHDLLFGTPDPYSKTAIPKEILHEIFSGDVRLTVHKIERK